MRLLLLTPEFSASGGGIATYYRVLMRELQRQGADVRVIEGSAVHTEVDRARHLRDGISVEVLEHSRLASWERYFSAFQATPALRRHLAAAWAMWEQADYGGAVDIVETTDWGLLFVPPAVEASRPMIVQCHGSIGQIAGYDPIAGEEIENLLVRLIERDVLSVTGGIETSSRSNAAFWRTETGQDVSTVLPAWSSLSSPQTAQVGDRALVIGRLQRWKGCCTLCEALRRLGTGAPEVDWFGRDMIWGARHYYASQHLARTFPDVWATKFRHYPQILPVEVSQRQSSAFFNIVPSTWDVFNFTAVEAMASGRPTIVSTGAGASELIEDGSNGFLFAKEDADALAATIERLMSASPAGLAEIGRAGRNTVRTALDPKNIAAQRLTAYREAIDAFNARPPAPVRGWLGAVCRPSAPVGDEMTFLNNLPLRTLTKHVAGRISRKLRLR